MTEAYREALIGSVNSLIQARHKLFGEALNLAMSGDMREINDAFEIGDTYTFELSHLKHSADANVNKLVTLIEEIQNTIDKIIEENEIEEDEIQWEEDEPEGDQNAYEMDPEDDEGAAFDWLITYKDGTQESFHGFADAAFEYALTKGKVFTVVKILQDDED